jgi:glycosidase
VVQGRRFLRAARQGLQDSSQDGAGDFGGLIQRLDYVAGLGVDVIWLLPFFPKPLRDDATTIADYYGIHLNQTFLSAFANLQLRALSPAGGD